MAQPNHKVMLVTGGSRGIGAATALLAARQGYAVAVNFTANSLAADEVVRQIRAQGGTAITVKADSVDTNSKQRDDHLRGPDFFSVKEFPEISFTSSSVSKSGEVFNASGTMSLHGVSKPITVDIRVTGTGTDPWGNARAGFTTEFTIDRTAFGVDWRPEMLGKDVTLTVSVEGVRKQ